MTNTKSKLTALAAAVSAAVYFGLENAEPVYAVPSPMSHEMSGTVQRIDRQTITVLSAGASKPEVFAWNAKETKFLRDSAPATVESLRVGSYVRIRCSHPLFGSRPVLYQVSWHTKVSAKVRT